MTFGEKIRALRESRGLTQASCDEIFDLMRGTVSNWENGYAYPEDELIADIAAYFGIKYRDLKNDDPL